MADAAVLLLLHQIVEDAVLGVQIGVDVLFAYVVEQIEVKVIHLALPQLLLKDLLHLGHVGQVIAGELVRQIKAVPGMPGQGPAHHQLRGAVVVAPGGVVVVDPVGHGAVHQLLGGGFIDPAVVPLQHRQAHTAQAQGRQLQALEFFIQHPGILLVSGFVSIIPHGACMSRVLWLRPKRAAGPMSRQMAGMRRQKNSGAADGRAGAHFRGHSHSGAIFFRTAGQCLPHGAGTTSTV